MNKISFFAICGLFLCCQSCKSKNTASYLPAEITTISTFVTEFKVVKINYPGNNEKLYPSIDLEMTPGLIYQAYRVEEKCLFYIKVGDVLVFRVKSESDTNMNAFTLSDYYNPKTCFDKVKLKKLSD